MAQAPSVTSFRAAEPIEPTLGFPLAMRHAMDAQLAGWVHWMEARLDLSGRSLSLAVAGEPDSGAGQFTCIARELIVDDFLLLTPLVDTLPYVDNLAALGGQAAGADSDPVHSELPSVDSLRTWADFVCCPVHAG